MDESEVVGKRVKGPGMTMSSQRKEITTRILRELWGNTRIAGGSSFGQFKDVKSPPHGGCIPPKWR